MQTATFPCESESTRNTTVFVVDDDVAGRESLCALVESLGYPCEAYGSAEDVLAVLRNDSSGCIISDFRMPGLGGLDLQQRLIAADCLIPMVIVTAYANTPMTVRALKAGAVTVLEKPCGVDELFSAIEEALVRDAEMRARLARQQACRTRIESLSEDERTVMQLMVEGMSNKAMAHRLDVSTRTVEQRRRNVFRKLQAESLADVIRLVVHVENFID